MRILVISDSHKRRAVLDKILDKHPDIHHVFFLGDNASDIEDFEFLYPNKTFYTVCGNCDFGSLLPSVNIEIINGVKILYTHGHTFGVKYGTERLLAAAKQNGSKIVLYGHTHISQILYEDGVYIVNPGSCSQPRDFKKPSYAIVDITEKGIMTNIIEI